jgi:deoxycytidylate deaminase
MNAPEQHQIAAALRAAARSPCRSKRGVALHNVITGAFRGDGFNGPPAPFSCPGREACAGNCGKRSVHAEVRALRSAAAWGRHHDLSNVDLVHVELAADGGVVPCGGPSCWQCSREIVDCGFVAGVWLYETVPKENCPHLVDLKRVDCPLCQGENCSLCHPGPARPRCDHDVIDRHHDYPVVQARWCRYTAKEFHRLTLKRCGMVP